MRLLVAALALLFTPVAHAQFSNRSLGVSLGYMSMNADPLLEWGLPLALESSLYIENGFEASMRVPLMLLTEKLTRRQVIAAGGNLGVRHLFSEEQLRPYVAADLVFLHIFRDNGTSNFFGLGPNFGVDYFAGDTVSLGARGFFNLYIALNEPLRTALGAQAVVSTYF
ncbi:MAG: hypothetical protein ACOZIN_13250 [Myxococcota bacterium]